ncbi:MAG: AsmA family protein [Gammaproteobacteria bacterium]|nr:AsmA family protein [Gammaproteobacteria bacterium]
MKIFFKISLAIIALLLIAIIGFAIVFDPNDYKDDVIKIVKDKTGRELSIPGDISLSLFPWIGIDLGAIEISNAKGFAKKPFAKMKHLQVRAKLWPLLKQQLEADTIVIEGLKLNLAKNKQGISNWDDLTKTTSKTRAATKTKEKAPSKTGNKKESLQNILGAIALNGLQIKNAQFNWHDQQTKQKITVKNVNLSIGELRPEIKIPFTTQFQLEEKTIKAKVNFKSNIVFSTDFQQFSFYDTRLSSDLKLASLKSGLSPQLSSALMQLNLKKQTFTTKKLNLSEGELKLETQLFVSKLFSAPHLKGQLTLATFNPRELAQRFAIKLPDMADKKALTKVNAQLNINGTLNKLGLPKIKITLDDSHLNGDATIKLTPGSSTVKLAIGTINVDRYLPKPASDKEKAAKSKNRKKQPAKTNEAILIPVGLLTAINVDADFKINKIQIKKTHWSNFHVSIHSKNGLIQIKPLTMSGYEAKVKTDIKLRVIKNNAFLSGNLNIQKIKAGKLLNDLIGKDKLKGQTTITASFNTSGIKLSQLKQNLNGKLKLYLKDGTIKGFDLEHQKNVLDAKLNSKPEPKAPTPVETKIARLSASAIIKKGILSNKDLRAATPLARVIGQGTVDIAKEKLNYTASVKFTSATNIKNNTPFEKMNSIPLDIKITGTFDKPIIKPDFGKVLSHLLKKELKKQETKIKDKVKKDIQKELEKKLGNELKNLFKF